MYNNPFSIIVLNHNNLYIDYCIESIKKHKRDFDEIIIVDDQSNADNYTALLKHLDNDCTILQNTERPHNLSYNRNLGVKNAKHDYLLFLDGDAYFYDDSIEQLRIRLNNPEIVCTTAFADGMHIAPLQLELVYKENLSQYIENDAIQSLGQKYFVRDHRRDLPMSVLQGKYNWPHFFGVCLAVKKEAYFAVGKFDERFSGWGIEDIDFTFRLKNHGKLLFVPEAQLLHIPHIRNRYSNYCENAYNNMECVRKYAGNPEWEVNYKFSDLYNTMSIIDLIRYYHKGLTYQLPFIEKHRTVYINALSDLFPNGNITVFKEDGKSLHFSHLGICIPFPNKQFQTCYFSPYFFNYPAPLLAIILQEVCRIAQTVFVPKANLVPSVKWGKDAEQKCKAHTLRFETYPVKLSDFIFTDNGNYYQITTSLPDSPYENIGGIFYELI